MGRDAHQQQGGDYGEQHSKVLGHHAYHFRFCFYDTQPGQVGTRKDFGWFPGGSLGIFSTKAIASGFCFRASAWESAFRENRVIREAEREINKINQEGENITVRFSITILFRGRNLGFANSTS